MTNLDGATARAWIDAFALDFAARAEDLGNLDRLAGDGDFADNVSSALGKARLVLDEEDPTTYRANFTALARGFLDTGGTSGPLFGMFFRSMAKASAADDVDTAGLATGVADGLGLIQLRGGAVVGDSTMVDALAPASAALTASARSGATVAAAVGFAAAAAAAGAASTADLLARRGRASYVGEHARGVLDPGAAAVALFFEAGARVLQD